MKKTNWQAVLLGGAFALLAGCNSIGNAPMGASPDQVKAEQEKEPPLQQIRNIMFAPLPPAQKEQQIKALETKYHVSRDDAMKNLPPPKFTKDPPPAIPDGKGQ